LPLSTLSVMKDFSICAVFILEIPSATDLYHCISEAQHVCEIVTLNEFDCKSRCSIDRAAFNQAIDEFTNWVVQNPECPPILHLSAHGSQTGIELPDGDEISWRQFQTTLQGANQAAEDGVVICLSCCEGLTCEQVLLHSNDGEKPFRGIIATGDKPEWSDTAVGFSAFYHRLANGSSVKDAVYALRIASGMESFLYICCDSAKDVMKQSSDGVASDDIVKCFLDAGV